MDARFLKAKGSNVTQLMNPTTLTEGVVFRKTTGRYFVHGPQRDVMCVASNRLRKELIYPEADASSRRQRVDKVRGIDKVDPIAVGDRVSFRDSGDGTGMIHDVLERRNKLSRAAAGRKPIEQILAANVDLVIPVFAVRKPRPRWGMLDRLLVAIEAAGLSAVVCISKTDLAREEDDIESLAALYGGLGYDCILTGAETGQGLETLRATLAGRTTLMLGKSGVGKSTLLNALQPGLGIRTREVSEKTDKGMHTTTYPEMFELDGGGRIIDTPGTREFGLWGVSPDELAACFPEMRPLLGGCHFSHCTHVHEPGCAIRHAARESRIHPRRYASYRDILSGRNNRA